MERCGTQVSVSPFLWWGHLCEKGRRGFRLKQNNAVFLCSFLSETETLLKCSAGALTGSSYAPFTASFWCVFLTFFLLTNPDTAVRTCFTAFLGCGVIGAAGILLLKKPKTFNSLEQPRTSAAVSHQNQFKKQSLQNMLIHADRCSTAVTTRRLWCLRWRALSWGMERWLTEWLHQRAGRDGASVERKRGDRRTGNKKASKYFCRKNRSVEKERACHHNDLDCDGVSN